MFTFLFKKIINIYIYIFLKIIYYHTSVTLNIHFIEYVDQNTRKWKLHKEF